MKRTQIMRHRLTWLIIPVVMATTIVFSLMVKPDGMPMNERLPAALETEAF